MELEDIPWPGELEEEEEAVENLDEYDVVMVEEMEEEEGREPDADFNCESQRRESTDDEEDEEAKAWLQAHPGRTLPQPSLPRHSCSEGEPTSPGKRTESWHYLPQEMDSSHTLDTAQTRFNVREKGTEVTDFPSLEEGILTQSDNQVKESNRDLLCSPLLVIQDNFASPDLPLLTCLTKDQEFGPDSLFHQSELDFAPLRGIPGKSEDTEWFSRPSEVSEALFQAASEVAPNLVNSCFSVSQHPLIGSTAIDSQRSLLTLEQGTKEEIVSPDTLEDLKTPKDSDSYDALYSYMSWKTQEVIQEPETNLADKDQVSFSTASDTSDEYITPKGSDSFDASCSYVQYGKQEALQQLEKYLTSKDRDSYSDSSDTIDKNKIHKESDNFSAPFSDMPWSKQGASHHPEICLISKDCVSFPHEVAPRFYSKMPHCFLHCFLERGGREVPLTADSHYFESVYLRAPAENEMKQKMDSLEGYKGIEEDLGKELSQCFELKENRNTLVFSEVHPRSSEIQYIENVVVTDNSVEVSEAHILSTGHDTSKMEVFGGPLQTIKSNSDETSEQLCFQEERNQKPPSAFGGKNVDATENVAFQAVIASIEPSEKESTVNEIQTDINKSLTNDSQENEPKNPDLSLLNYDENFFFDKLNHPRYQSTPGVFESAASKPLLYKKDDGDSSLYWHPNIKSLPSAPQEIFIKPLSLSPELKSSSSLSEKSLRQAVGLGKTQSALFQYDTDNEPFLPIGKIKSVSALDLAEKLGSSNIIYPVKVWTSDSLVLQDLKQHTFEEVADSSNCILGKNGNSSNVIEDPSVAVGSSFSANLVACNAKSQGALPVISDASLIAVGQETLLKADIDQGEIPRPVGAKSSFTVYTIMQNDSYFVEGLQGKAESDIYTLDDTECCSLDENDVVCRKRVVELQREICDQGDLTGECIKLAGLENLLDDLEICDSSLHWQSTIQLPSKEESSFEEPVCLSNMDINQSFASVLPPSVPHEPTRELEYHSSDLRMLRVSPDTVPGTFKHSTGDTSKGDIAEIPQSTLRPGITTTPEDSDTVSHLSLSPEDFSQLAGRSPQVKNIGQHTDTLNQQTLADSRLTEKALKVSAVPGLADQKTEIATVPSSSYSKRGKPNIFYPQGLPDGYLTEETLKVAAVPGLGDQKTSISTVCPSFYSLGEKHSIFYPQALPDGHQTEEGLNISVLLGLADLKTGKPTVPASSYSVGEEPGIFYQQALPGSHLPEEALKVSPSPRPVDEKTGLPTASSTSYSHGEKPRIFYQQTLPESHLTEQALKVSAASGPPEQKTGIPIVTSTSYSHREKLSILCQQELPDSHLTEQAQKVSAAPGLAEQKTWLPTVPSISYSHREKPSIFYQQELPDSHVIQEVQQVSAALGLAERKTGIPTIPSTSYSHREEPLIFYQQELPDSCLTEQAEQVSAAPGLAEQKTGISTVPSTSYSHREKPSILYQQELPVSHLIQQVQQASAAPGLAEQKTGISTVPSTSYSHREKPSILYQQELPDSHLTEQAQKVSPAPGTPEQKTGIPIVTSTYSHREKPSIFYQQDLPDSHLAKKAQKVPAFPGLAHQKSGTPIAPPAFYSHRGKTSVIYQQELPDSLLTEEAVKVSAFPRTADQNTGIPTGSSRSYSFGEKPGDFFYQQVLPDGNLSEEALKVSPASRPSDQKTGVLSVPASSYSHREKPSIFYPQALPGSHLSEEALKDSTISGLADQKTGTSEPSGSYSHKEKSSVFYQQELPDSHLTGEAQKVSGVTGTGDQKTGIPIVTSASYLHKEKPTIFYQQALPDRYLTEEALNVSTAPRPTDQKTGIPAVPSSSYSYREKPIISYQQELPDLTQVALKVLEVPGPADRKIGIPAIISTSSSYGEKPIISYQQELPDPNEDALKRLELPGQADQTTGMRIVPPTSYSHRESPIFSYQKELPDITEETLKVSAVPGPADQKIGIQTVPSSSYSYRESPIFSYQKELPDTTEETLKVFALPGPADQNAEIPTGPSSSYSHKEKLRILPDDQKAELLSAPLSSYSHREKPKTSTVIGPGDQKTPLLTAWNLKFNMAHECGYSISEINEDDRRKVEEIKAKLFGHGRTTDLPKGLQSPQGIECKPEAVCSHIIIESHEKGCFRTLTAERPQLDSHPCVFRSAEPSEMIRGQRSPSSWTTGHINLAKSLDQNNSHFKVWNSLQLQSHSPFQNFIGDDLKISKGLRMPFREKLDPWLSELVEPACMPPEEMDCQSSSQMLPPEPMKKFTTSIIFSSHRHSKCFSDSSFLKVGVTEGSQCTGASVGLVNSHITEEQNPPRDLKEKTSSPSSFKIISQSPDKAVTILAENSRQSQKLSVAHSHQEEKPLERSDFKGSHSKPSTSANDSNFKEVHFSDNDTLISMGRPSSTLGVKEKNVTITPDLPSNIFLGQELFEQSKASHADHRVRKHNSPPPQHQDHVAANLPCRIFLEKRELFKQSKTQHKDNQLRENHSPLPQSQDYIASDLPSRIFLEQRQLFEQSKAPDVDHHMGEHHSSFPQDQDYIVEKNNQHEPKLHISDMINVEAKFSDVASPSAPNQCTVVTSASTPPSNRKALSCVRITLCPKTPSKLDSGTLDKRFHSLDPASKTRMNSEFNSDLQTISSESLEPTSTLLTSKPVAQDQESLDFLGPKSSPDFQVVQPPLPDSNIISQDLKTIPFQNSQIVTSRQTQVNISDLEGYSNPEGTPVSAVRSPKETKTPFSPFSGKLSSDAVTQITTESPRKAMFSSEIFVNAEDRGHDIPELSTRKLGKVPVKFASSSSVQQITVPHGTDGQPLLLPYKPSGSTKMYYVPQLRQIPSSLDSKSDTTIESSHSGSNDAIAPDFPAHVLGTRDDDLADTVNIKHKEGIYSKRVVTKASLSMGKKPFQKDNADAQVQVLITGDEDPSDKNQKKEIYSKRAVTEASRSEEKESLQKDITGSSAAAASEQSAQLQDTKIVSLPDTKATKQKEEIHSKRTVPKEGWPEEKKSLQIDIAESRCHSEFENTTHSVFRSAKFYFHHPVHLPSDQDFCHESLGRRVFMSHSWKDSFQHHPDKQREHTCLPSSYQNVAKTKSDYTTIESLSINVNLENKEVKHTTKSQARDFLKYDKQVNDLKRDHKATPELTAQHTVSLNELWNRYQERQSQQKPPEFSAKKELSLVERLDHLAKLLQHPITHFLQPSESTQDDSKGKQDVKEWSGRQQQQKNKLQKKKRYKSLEKCHKNTGDLKKNKVLSTHQAGRSNQIKIEQIKFDKYILRKQPGFHYINNTSSDSRHSEESELLTDTATNILSTTTSVESDILTQTDKEVTLHERSSSISTIDTARLIHAFGHERVCLSPRRIKLYSSITDHQRRYLEKRSKKNKKPLSTGYPQITSEHTRRKHVQVTDHISSDSVSSSTSSFWSSSSTLCNKRNVHMLNKGIQAGTLEIVNGVRKHTRDVGMTFPTPSSSEARVEEDSDVTSWSEEKIEEKRLLTSYLGDRKLRKNKQSCWEGVSWFVPVENVKSGPKKENLPKFHGPGVSWFAPVTNTTPWREPLQKQNWQGQHMDSHSSLAGPGRDPLKPFVRATLQESLQLHRPDFISRSGERIKRLKLIVQERKLQNMLQSEREALFNTVRGWQGHRDAMHLLPKRGFLAAQKKRPVGKKEMIQRSKWIYEQLPEVQKKREEEKRRLEYKSYRLRAQLYKKKLTNQLLGRKVPWN
ncbi:Alstrom syndrome protein 1 isoform X4 [Monodon monoceros]|uniref:Alstrom syndrome protein 1 isoform X4 n=1 Tax=Monodon monoceros TaxID=40151 RepID=UPI0010F85E79|nr:Alstrom syndrome protein 1 isoform X4 [Monodon monoceros]